ncbi:MAG: metal ABC transporter substrate-binding protein [Lachnospiraceae bacterium]
MREKRIEDKARARLFCARLMAVILAAGIAAAAVTGCGVKQEEPDDGKLKIVTTIFPQYDFVRAIAGGTGAVNVRMLLSPGEEVHSYEPTPLDIKEIQNCDLFIYVGAENDVWVDRILENMGDKRPETLRLVDLTETVAEESVEGMMEEKGHDHEESREEEADEHVWTSPVKAAEITEAIAQKIAELDPANADDYLANAQDYEAKILDLDAQFRQIAENAERKVLVFGDRFPIRYFAEGYGLDYFAAFPGCSSESEPSASTLAFLIDKVREEEIPVVFSIEFSNGNIARAICESTGAVQRTYNSCHNVTKEQMENGATYVSLMSENLEAVREALGKGAKK